GRIFFIELSNTNPWAHMEWDSAFVSPASVRVLLVDDQISVREMLAVVLGRERRFTVVAEASSGLEGLRAFRKFRTDVVITALALPEMGGPEMILAMREERPAARMLVYTGSRSRPLLLAALEAGPQGFVHKVDPLSALCQALHAVADGFSFLGPFVTKMVEETRSDAKPHSDLTPKQRVVLQMVAEGLSTKQVAGRLSLSPKTVEHYRTQVMQKLGLRDVASLTRYAVRCGLVTAE
ncbi:MAG: response regulator, partial [Chthoniobacterales bacterium]